MPLRFRNLIKFEIYYHEVVVIWILPLFIWWEHICSDIFYPFLINPVEQTVYHCFLTVPVSLLRLLFNNLRKKILILLGSILFCSNHIYQKLVETFSYLRIHLEVWKDSSRVGKHIKEDLQEYISNQTTAWGRPWIFTEHLAPNKPWKNR